MENKDILELDGNSLTVDQLMSIKITTNIKLSDKAWDQVRKSRSVLEEITKADDSVYGINTGVGSFSHVNIDFDLLEKHQLNIIVSHAAGLGNPLTPERVKRMLILRINVLAKGFSGISAETLERMIAFSNAGCLSKVPEQGTVGASGDLCPLSHLALGMLGQGEMWDPQTQAWCAANVVIEKFGLKKFNLKKKEGVALINGTQFITSLGAEAIYRAENVALSADILIAMSTEALRGSKKPFDLEIHQARPHLGQLVSAKHIQALLDFQSEINESHKNCKEVQDAYCLRCAPQVHGIVYDTILFAKKIIETEMNSATDNPMVFVNSRTIVSGGNFHGEYPGKALDFLAIAVQELGLISERRTERLLNSHLSGLPHLLVRDGGINSGYMMLQIMAAALANENKTLSHPATADSIPTNAGKEDHVSMGGWAARKCLQVIENVESILAMELLASAQGLDFRHPLKSTKPINELLMFIRNSGIHFLEEDRYLTPEMEKAKSIISGGNLVDLIKPYW